MSIIHDALKKAQRQMTNQNNPNNQNTPNKQNIPNQDPTKSDDAPQDTSKDISSLYEKFYQKQTKVERGGASPGPGNPAETSKTKQTPPFTFQSFFKVVLCLGVVIASFAYIVYYLSSKDAPPDMRKAFLKFKRNLSVPSFKPARKAAPAHAVVTEEVTSPPPQPMRTASDGTLVLNGTVQTGDRQVALINDQIYEIGDMVGDKRIVGISLNEVQLQDGENIITLKGKNR